MPKITGMGRIKKPVTLDGVEFLRRFTMHILPTRFVKIRRYGIYNHTVKRNLDLQFVPEEKPDIDTLIKSKEPPETNLQRFERLTGVNPCQCPVCKTGRMVIVRELPRIRSPGFFLPKSISCTDLNQPTHFALKRNREKYAR